MMRMSRLCWVGWGVWWVVGGALGGTVKGRTGVFLRREGRARAKVRPARSSTPASIAGRFSSPPARAGR